MESARAAWGAGDLDRARAEAARALQLAPGDEAAVAIAARVSLARGEPDRARRQLERATAPALVVLRARASLALGDLRAVERDLESVEDAEHESGWADAVLALARAAGDAPLYEVSGAPEASLAFAADVPLPVVEITAGARTVRALVATSTALTVIDDGVRATPGVHDELALGALRVRNVPVLVRDLSTVSAQLGVELGAVLGIDLLARLGATIDGRARALVVRATPRSGVSGASVAYVTLEGSFLAVRASPSGGAEGWYTIDSAGLFPVALGDAAAAAQPAAGWVVPEGAPSPDVRVAELPRLLLGEIAIEGVPAVTGLVPPELSARTGAPVDGIVGGLALAPFRVTIDPGARRLVIE